MHLHSYHNSGVTEHVELLFGRPEHFINILSVETPDEPDVPHPKEEGPEKNLARLLEKVEGCSVRTEGSGFQKGATIDVISQCSAN